MISNQNKNILWIFSHPKPLTIPSYVVGGIMPADYLGIKKIVLLENHNPIKLLDSYNPQCIIVSKVFNSKVFELVVLAKNRGIKIISIYDDWYFPDEFRKNINFPIAQHSNIIVAKTRSAANHIKENINIDCKIIPDPIRFNKEKIFSKISQPLSICWYGMHTNHDTLLNELPSLDNLNLKIELNIISNELEELKAKIKRLTLQNILARYLNWSQNSNFDIIKSSVVILPYPKDKKRFVKSANRIIDSLNLGRFTVLSNVEQFEEFKNYTFFGKISEGILWLTKNPKSAQKITLDGQNYVEKNYSLKNICEKWLKLIN